MATPTKPAPKSFTRSHTQTDETRMPAGSTRCIITGHRRGLGLGLTRELLARQCAVLGISRGTTPDVLLDKNTPLAGSHTPDSAVILQEVQMDLSDSAALIDWLYSGALTRFLAGAQRIVLINNAGQLGPVGLCGQFYTRDGTSADAQKADQASHDMARALAANITAALLLTDAVLGATAGHLDRRVMHISSGAGRSAYAGWSTYCTSKAALDHHARVLQAEGHAGLRVSSVAPGVIDTDMQTQLRQTDPAQFPMQGRFVALKEQGGLASPEQAASTLINYLLSDRFGTEAVSDIRSICP